MIYPGCSLGKILKLERRPVEIVPDKKYAEIGIYCFGKGIFHKEPRSGLEVGDKKLFQIKEGDLILQVTFAWEGAVGLASKKEDGMHGSTRFPTFRVNEDLCYPSFLLNYFKTKEGREQLIKISPGSAGRNRVLSLKRIHEVMIPIPPIDEQRRIVARIEELAARIEEARELRKRAVEESEALFNKIVRKVFEKFTGETIAIGDVFKVTTGGTPSRANPLFWGGDIRWVSSGEVAFCRIKNTLEKITLMGVENSNAHLYPPNTVLIAMIGQGKTRGQCAILDCNATTNQNIAAIHVYETQHSPEFVYWWLYSRYTESRSAETGTAQPALSGTRVKQMPIPLPPISEQMIAVNYLNSLKSKLDALRRHQAETAAALEALLPAVLERAFRGEL